MSAIEQALRELRATGPSTPPAGLLPAGPLGEGLAAAGIRFAAIGGPLGERWQQALRELDDCIRPLGGSAPVLNEGGVYRGSWLESTATINSELLARFAPDVARDTHLLFAARQRDDGMLPYKVTDEGAGFSQIQIVTPLARTVWNGYLRNRDRDYLATMYAAMSRYDGWLAEHRDTRGTGAVEAFCTFDTGHDLSPRFWFAPDRCWHGDAAQYDPDSPTMPYLAPDLTANVACQRSYLALIAEELGDDPRPWLRKAEASRAALWAQCWHDADELFYDRDRGGELVRVQSDVLLRVLACEIGDDAFFAQALERYLMNTGKFLAHYGFTSLALDDPRFDHDYHRNSWGGPVNFLSLIRAPHAFELHGRVAELGVTTMPVLAAIAVADRFPQCLDPLSGAPGFTEAYSPSILWLLDTVERFFGILPQPGGDLWFTGLAPTRLDHGAAAQAVAYARDIDGVRFELAADDERTVVYRDHAELFAFPRGWRVVAGGSGEPTAVVGVAAGPVSGRLTVRGTELDVTVAPNERVELRGGAVSSRTTTAMVAPHR